LVPESELIQTWGTRLCRSDRQGDGGRGFLVFMERCGTVVRIGSEVRGSHVPYVR
jgi:hypothetical protein